MQWLACLGGLLLLRLLLGVGWPRWRVRWHRHADAGSGQDTSSSSSGGGGGGGGAAVSGGGMEGPPPWLSPPGHGGPLAQHEGPLPLQLFVQLVRQQWELLGLPHRPLAPAELEALARQAGFADGLAPGQPLLPAAAAQRFAAWFAEQLSVVHALGAGVYGCRQAQLVAGFDVGRAEVEARLQQRPPGTCCLRLGSVPGHLVLSVAGLPSASRGGAAAAAGGGPAATPVSHYLLSAVQLYMSGLPRAVAGVPGCTRLLDLSSGRTHRLSLLKRASQLHAGGVA